MTNEQLRDIALTALKDGDKLSREIGRLYVGYEGQPSDAAKAEVIARIAAAGVALAECFVALLMTSMAANAGGRPVEVHSQYDEGSN